MQRLFSITRVKKINLYKSKLNIITTIILMLILCKLEFVYAQMPDISAHSAIVIDADTSRILYEKNPYEILPMASTTKIMTAILALENGNPDDIVTVSDNAVGIEGSSISLQPGEKQRVEDLVYGIMLSSGNDAAVAIAEHISGSVEEFCAMMNKKAVELGAADTNFETPNGLDAEEHHSTAYDMALITRYALGIDGFKELIATKSISIESNKCTYSIVNKNRLLSEYEGAIGVKTGFTGKAGHCFVGAAESDGMTLISVVLGSGWGTAGRQRKWIDTKNMLNYGFQKYDYFDICIKGDYIDTIPVNNSYGESIRVCTANDIKLPLSQAEREALYAEVKLPDKLDAPVKEGDEVGRILFKIDSDMVIAQSPLLACSTVNKKNVKTTMKMLLKYWINPMKSSILKNN